MELDNIYDFDKELKIPKRIKGIKDENLIIKTKGTENLISVLLFLVVFLMSIYFLKYYVIDETMPKKIELIVKAITFFLIVLAVIVYILSKQKISFDKDKIIYKNNIGIKKSVDLENNPIVYVDLDYYSNYLYIETDTEKIKIRLLVSYKKALRKLINNLELE